MNQAIIKTIDLGDGRTITIETGRLAKQADGAVVVKMGDTMLLATVVAAQDAKEDVDFMPLSVDYREKFANPYRAAALGYIDEIILPQDTRTKIIQALKMTHNKRQSNLPRKHGNMPL